MTDGAGAYSEAVRYELEQEEDGGWVLTVAAEESWLEAEERVFPVAIDPTLIDQTKEADLRGRCVPRG